MGNENSRARLVLDGQAILEYTREEQERPTADDAKILIAQPTHHDLDRAASAVLRELQGWWLNSSDTRLIDALLAQGATTIRHVHLYSRHLGSVDTPDPHLPPPFRWSAAELDSMQVAELLVLAYPPGHVDHLTNDPAVEEQEISGLLTGEVVGPLLYEATVAILDPANRLVAVSIVNRSPGPAPAGGPWVSQLFRHPDASCIGLGGLALRKSVANLAANGESSVGLAVTDGNPAARLYTRIGFRHISSRIKVAIPPQASRS